jgi:hypothetical protein
MALAVAIWITGTQICFSQSLPPLPEGSAGIASQYPDDAGIESDPDVIFADDFESYTDAPGMNSRWNGGVYHNVSLTREIDMVYAGSQSLEFYNPQQDAELSNTVARELSEEQNALFLRYYSRFHESFDVTGSTHNGGGMSASYYINGQATPGIPADGFNKFLATLECWRGEASDPSPGHLNVYIYHPEQRSQWGDHFFPTGMVLPNSSIPGDFGSDFVSRPDVVPELGRWYCYEFMIKANTPGERDGRIGCWLDGQLIADFPNLRLRDIDTLKIDRFNLSMHIGSNTAGETWKWYDNVVAAKSYIGPLSPTSPVKPKPESESYLHSFRSHKGITLSFTLADPSPTAIDIYTFQGRLIRHLLRESLPAGSHSLTWNCRDEAGKKLAGGVYLARIQTADNTWTGKIIMAP